MAQIGYIESLLGSVQDLNTRLAIRRVAEELLGRIAVLEAATGVVPDTPTGPSGPATPAGHHDTHEPGGTDELENAAWTDKVNTFKQTQYITNPDNPVGPTNLYAGIVLNDRTQPVDGRLWRVLAAANDLYLQAINDAQNTGIGQVRIARAGNLIATGTLTSTGRQIVEPGAANYQLELRHSGHTGLILNETGRPVDGKKWRIHGNAGSLYIEPLNDAETAVPVRSLAFNRDGTVTTGGNMLTTGYVYPGRADNGQAQGSWILASHGSYGLYTNTGFYIAGQLYGIPFTFYTPTWQSTGTQPNIGNGATYGWYVQLGSMVFFKITVVMGSTTTYGTGNYRLTLPIAWNAGLNSQIADLMMFDSSGGTWWRGIGLMEVAGAVALRYGATSIGPVSPTGPQTWAVNDQFHIQGSYFI